MTADPPSRRPLLLDACVLIDYLKTDRSILPLIARHVGPIHVASPVSDEVNEITREKDLARLGLIVVEPEIEDALAAATERGSTSFQDRLCCLTARRFGFVCVTNDTRLRKRCQREGLPVLWGLQLIGELHANGGISARRAITFANRMHETNPWHLSEKIVQRFIKAIQDRQD